MPPTPESKMPMGESELIVIKGKYNSFSTQTSEVSPLFGASEVCLPDKEERMPFGTRSSIAISIYLVPARTDVAPVEHGVVDVLSAGVAVGECEQAVA